MAFAGFINWPFGVGTLAPENGSFLVGEDGKHYSVLFNSGAASATQTLTFGQVESNAVQASRTRAQIVADCGVVTGNVNAYDPKNMIPVVGTPFIGVFCRDDADTTRLAVPFYKINAASALEFVGYGAAYAGLTDDFCPAGGGNTGIINATVAASGEVYFIVQVRRAGFPVGLRYALAHVPYLAGDVDLTPGSWNQRVTAAPFSTTFMSGASGGGMTYANRCCLIDRGAGIIGLLRYLNQADIDSNGGGIGLTQTAMYYCEFDTVNRNISYPLTDKSALFGVPLSDLRKNFSGIGTSVNYDDYFGPVAVGNEIFGLRNYSDNPNCLGIRRWDFPDRDTVESLGFTQLDGFAGEAFLTNLEGGTARRVGVSDTVQFLLRDRTSYHWLATAIPLAEETPPTIVYPPEIDTVDELPPVDAEIETQRWLLRTGHIREWGEVAVDDLRVTIKRGVGDTDFEPKIWVRVNRDNKGFGRWAKRGLGKKGERTMTVCFGGFGTARDWQFEFATTDDCEIELRKVEIMSTPLGH